MGGIIPRNKQNDFTRNCSPALQRSLRINSRRRRLQLWELSGHQRNLPTLLTLLLRNKDPAVARDSEGVPPRRTKRSRPSSMSLLQCSTKKPRKRSPLRRTRLANWRVISTRVENL